MKICRLGFVPQPNILKTLLGFATAKPNLLAPSADAFAAFEEYVERILMQSSVFAVLIGILWLIFTDNEVFCCVTSKIAFTFFVFMLFAQKIR